VETQGLATSSLDALGLESRFDVGIRLRVPSESLGFLGAQLDSLSAAHPASGVRLAGAQLDASVHRLTFAISLGTTEDVACETEPARQGVALLADAVESLAEFLPGLCELPARGSDEAQVAEALLGGALGESGSSSVGQTLTTIRELVAVAR